MKNQSTNYTNCKNKKVVSTRANEASGLKWLVNREEAMREELMPFLEFRENEQCVREERGRKSTSGGMGDREEGNDV